MTSQSFYRKVASSVMTHGLGMVIGFVGSVILARTLGPEGRGVVSWMIALNIIGATFCQLGMPIVNKRYGAAHPEQAGTLLALTIGLCLLTAVLLMPVMYWLAGQNQMADGNKLALGVVLAMAPLLAMADALAA